MAASRSLVRTLLARQACLRCVQSVPRRCSSQHAVRPTLTQQRAPKLAYSPTRWHSAPATKSRVYDFDQMKRISDEASSDTILIDVREPAELDDGYIPGAINIPIKSQPDALFLPDDEFEDRFGFSKPEKDKEVVFYCKAGVRASAAAQLAEQQGYGNVAEYRGSMLDWNKQGGPVEMP